MKFVIYDSNEGKKFRQVAKSIFDPSPPEFLHLPIQEVISDDDDDDDDNNDYDDNNDDVDDYGMFGAMGGASPRSAYGGDDVDETIEDYDVMLLPDENAEGIYKISNQRLM